jgi:hypothetical protein
MTSEQAMQRKGMSFLAGGTRHCAHQGSPHSSQSATACSVQCFVQLLTPVDLLDPGLPRAARIG